MQLERIHNNSPAYRRENLEKLEAQAKQTLTADAITFEGHKRHPQEKWQEQNEAFTPHSEEHDEQDEGLELPRGTSKRERPLLDVTA